MPSWPGFGISSIFFIFAALFTSIVKFVRGHREPWRRVLQHSFISIAAFAAYESAIFGVYLSPLKHALKITGLVIVLTLALPVTIFLTITVLVTVISRLFRSQIVTFKLTEIREFFE